MSLSPSSTAGEIIAHLRSLGSEDNLAGMARFGIVTDAAIGLSNIELHKITRLVKTDHRRALALWQTGIREARILAAFTADPKVLTLADARRWAEDCNSWEVVDTVADLFIAARFERELIPEFSADEREFVRRIAFAMIATAAVHLKKEPDAALLAWLPLIEQHSGDERNFVKKAVNWALRQIGKRNAACHGPALALAKRLAESSNRAARWTGKDAVRELSNDKILARLGLP